MRLTSGSFEIKAASHGLEGKDNVSIANVEINITSGKDGIHAESEDDANLGFVYIQSGTFNIFSEGDGISASAWLQIDDGTFRIVSGGYIVVCGLTVGDTATLDYNISGVITGGTFIGTGTESRMAQSFSNSEQAVVAVRVGNQPAGTPIALKDSKGNTVISSYAPELDFADVILSSPDIVKGGTYTITVGSVSSEVTAD